MFGLINWVWYDLGCEDVALGMVCDFEFLCILCKIKFSILMYAIIHTYIQVCRLNTLYTKSRDIQLLRGYPQILLQIFLWPTKMTASAHSTLSAST